MGPDASPRILPEGETAAIRVLRIVPEPSSGSPRQCGDGSRAMTDRKSALRWTLLALLTVGLLLVSRAYYIADKRPPTFDDAWFLETSLRFYHRLTERGIVDFLYTYAQSFRTKAPLISVLPLPKS